VSYAGQACCPVPEHFIRGVPGQVKVRYLRNRDGRPARMACEVPAGHLRAARRSSLSPAHPCSSNHLGTQAQMICASFLKARKEKEREEARGQAGALRLEAPASGSHPPRRWMELRRPCRSQPGRVAVTPQQIRTGPDELSRKVVALIGGAPPRPVFTTGLFCPPPREIPRPRCDSYVFRRTSTEQKKKF